MFKDSPVQLRYFDWPMVDQFRVRYDRWIKEVKTHFLQA